MNYLHTTATSNITVPKPPTHFSPYVQIPPRSALPRFFQDAAADDGNDNSKVKIVLLSTPNKIKKKFRIYRPSKRVQAARRSIKKFNYQYRPAALLRRATP